MNISSVVAAQVLSATGDAWLVEAGRQLPLTAGLELLPGQLIQTGHHGTTHIQLASGHELGLGPDQFLLLDEDVLADTSADTSEWTLGARAIPAMVAEWVAPDGRSLELAAVLEVPGESLDQLLQSSSPVSANDADMHQLMLAGIDDDGLNCLLRSLYGPESG